MTYLRLLPIVSLLLIPTFSAAAEPKAAPVIRSTRSGPWSAAATWEGGKVPGAGSARPQSGRAMRSSSTRSPSSRSVRSTLPARCRLPATRTPGSTSASSRFRPATSPAKTASTATPTWPTPDADMPRPALEVGTPDRPIDAKHTALIRLHYVDGMDKESCPAIVCCGGRMDFHGTPLNRTWVKLGDDRRRRATRRSRWPKPSPAGRSATASSSRPPQARRLRARTQAAPRNASSRPSTAPSSRSTSRSTFEHLGNGDYRGEVANLSRNVVVESADPDGRARPHHVSPQLGRLDQLRRVPPSRQGRRARPLQPALSTLSATRCAAAPSSAPRSGTAAIAG